MSVINNLGAIAIFFALAVPKIFWPRQFREIIQHVFYIGANSSSIVLLVGSAFSPLDIAINNDLKTQIERVL
jgi:hypothetical protein